MGFGVIVVMSSGLSEYSKSRFHFLELDVQQGLSFRISQQLLRLSLIS